MLSTAQAVHDASIKIRGALTAKFVEKIGLKFALKLANFQKIRGGFFQNFLPQLTLFVGQWQN